METFLSLIAVLEVVLLLVEGLSVADQLFHLVLYFYLY